MRWGSFVGAEHTFTVTVCDSCKRSDEKWSLRMLVAWLRTVAAKCVTSVAEAIVFWGTVAAKLATDLARAHRQILQLNRKCFVEVEVDAADAASW
jgi:hypothetical protein